MVVACPQVSVLLGRSAGGPGEGTLFGAGMQSRLGEVEAAQKFGGKDHRGWPRPARLEPKSGPSFALSSVGLFPFPAPQKASVGRDPELDGGLKVEDPGDAYHVDARHLLYPNCPVQRFPVPNEKVPWEVSACSAASTRLQGPGVLGGSSPAPWAG